MSELKIILSHEMSSRIEIIGMDEHSAKQAFSDAQINYANTLTKIGERKALWWNDLYKDHKELDRSIQYLANYDKAEGRIVVTEVKENHDN